MTRHNNHNLYSNFLRPITFLYIGIFVLIAVLVSINFYQRPISEPKNNSPKVEQNAFENLDLKAKAVYVYDTEENKVLFEKNARTPLPLASITKLMTTDCVLQGRSSNLLVTVPDTVYSYNDHATSTGATELWRLEDLAIYTLIVSSNAGAETMAKVMGGDEKALECMNDKALTMNLFDTKFNNVTGLDLDTNNAGAYGSAENVVTLLEQVYLEHPDIIGKTSYSDYEIRSQNGTIHKALNTNIVANDLVGFLGSKTGLTDIAGGNITYIMNAGLNHKIFVAILGSTETERFSDAITINKAVVESFLDNK